MNCKQKALIVVSEAVQYELFKNYFKDSTNVEADVKNFDGEKAYDFIKEHGKKYNMIVLDVGLEHRDGISIINDLYQEGLTYNYILISAYNTVLLKKITSILPTIHSVFINPKYIKDIELAIINANNSKYKSSDDEIAIKTIISKQLHKLGMPAHIKGYQYIREGIYELFTTGNKSTKITKELYPHIADMFNTTPSRVERAIRHSIEVSWSRGDYEVMESIFGNSVDFERAKPTNSEFLSSVTDAILLENRMQKSIIRNQVNYN
ncbi:MAG: sporulation initiation factor Spo0A C-terminal domain-containing protein [Bacilli bacterium]